MTLYQIRKAAIAALHYEELAAALTRSLGRRPRDATQLVGMMAFRWTMEEPDPEFRWRWEIGQNEDGTWSAAAVARSCDPQQCRDCNIVHVDVDAESFVRAVYECALLAIEHRALLGETPPRLTALATGFA